MSLHSVCWPMHVNRDCLLACIALVFRPTDPSRTIASRSGRFCSAEKVSCIVQLALIPSDLSPTAGSFMSAV